MSILKCYASYHDILGRKLLLSTVILSTLSGTTYAAGCTENAPGTGNYTCTGVVDTTQTLDPGLPLTVVTESGFSIETSVNPGFVLRGTGGLSFNDDYQSAITGATEAFNAVNNTSGTLSINTTGSVTSTGLDGISATNYGTVLTIQAVDVTGGRYGIVTSNQGTEALSITTTGSVAGTGQDGINATNYGTDLTIQAVDVTGGRYGIATSNQGTGGLSITTTGMVTGASNYGISATNYGTDLTIQATNATGRDGIYP